MASSNNSRAQRAALARSALFVSGLLLIAAAPVVGALPGPGGIFLFGAGLGLVLKSSGWAKRVYVRFKRKHPRKGAWADWGLRRSSARRRQRVARLAQAQPEAFPDD